MAKEYDLVIVGGGTGGYVAAIKASQLGLKTAIVEKNKLGGTCLHAGCIPSKALLRSAEVFKTINEGEKFGILTNPPVIDFLKVQQRKSDIVEQLHKGVQHLMKKGKIDIYYGIGRILGPSIFSPLPGTVSVEMADGSENEILLPKNVLIATGSKPKELPGLETDGEYVLSSDEALQIEQLPESILIVGGGVIGIEWASMLADFGVEVTIVESADRILPSEDAEISKEITKLFKRKGIHIQTRAKIFPDTLVKGDGVSIRAEVNGETIEMEAKRILLSIGRTANITDIGIENTNIKISNGVIEVNSFYQTKENHIYAIGDCIGGMQLAHVATREGTIAVEHISDLKPEQINYDFVPRCVYSNPEVASIGLTEEEAIKRGHKIKIGKFPFKAIGKALVYGESDGFVKIIADQQSDDLLGVHLIGPHATELISEASLATVFDAAPWEIAFTIHPHPTLSEIFMEASLAIDNKAIHG